MKTVCFDLTGTLVDHHSGKPLALMPNLLSGFAMSDWKVVFMTRWSEGRAEALIGPVLESSTLRRDQLDLISTDNKAGAIRQLMESNVTKLVFIDDKPENLLAVASLADPRLRVIGFLGSRKYVPGAADFCQREGIEYALSPINLAEAEGLNVSIPFAEPEEHSFQVRELLELLPGLHHPASALAGETSVFDHRMIPTMLLRSEVNLSNAEFARFWNNLAWVCCNECQWKLMVRLATRQAGIDEQVVLEGAYSAEEHLAALQSAPEEIRNRLALPMLDGFALMQDGIEEVGNGASFAPCNGCPMDVNRMDLNRQRLSDVW
jgi:hypothetical protein